MYPDSEGMYIPNNEKFWLQELNGYSCVTGCNPSCGTFSMPIYGYYLGTETIGYILHTDLHNTLQFYVDQNRLTNLLTHNCNELDKIYNYEISIAFTGPSPLGPAFNYKKYLIATNAYKTLSEKVSENPDIKKLFGAPHIYIWGDGRTDEFLKFMNNLTIDRLWIGFEQSLSNIEINVDKKFIDTAVKLGYLVGPCDEFHTMMDPKLADCPNVIFEGMFPNAAIVNSDGKKNIGFAGRGYHISSEALLLNNNKSIYNRINKFLKMGINSYFLDCDATGELFDDYSKDHTMSQYKDRENRLKRMAYISQDKKLVFGSETAAAWSVPVLAFAHCRA